ncbi:hypothetical protein PILCRDRAFT_827789 [Piloderma croceum F 1598]|uniref:Ribonuclease P protein subunit n=1 Tax=Piloderma croceum (strain F 1598) TaxID=765440 RepID=A0A0C3EQK7_PILCF|nr:hypothetical protein PILCRDRAFT_827789 [Piloderma croceum F 1598]
MSLSESSDPVSIYNSRIKSRQIILENPARQSKAKQQRDDKRAKIAAEKAKRKAGMMGRREASEKGTWKLEKEQTKFHLFLPLHHLWLGYMSELLSLAPSPPASTAVPAMPTAASMHAKLVKADYHGSFMAVKQSKNPCLVGLSGIVIHETENAFKVVTKTDRLKLLPKQNSIFAFAVPVYSTLPSFILAGPSSTVPLDESDISEATKTTVLDQPHIEFELYGNQFRFRSADRAGRKFKPKETIEL